jgi:hypothetical protein
VSHSGSEIEVSGGPGGIRDASVAPPASRDARFEASASAGGAREADIEADASEE